MSDPVQVVAEALGARRGSEVAWPEDIRAAIDVVAALRASGHIPDPDTHAVIAKADLPTLREVTERRNHD
jgi:hypothetical protein